MRGKVRSNGLKAIQHELGQAESEDSEDHCPEEGEGLRVSERVEEFPLLPGEHEHRHESEDDDHHRKEHRPTNLRGGFERVLKHLRRREAAV